MPKKSFKENPALQFISHATRAQDSATDALVSHDDARQTGAVPDTNQPDHAAYTDNTHPTQDTHDTDHTDSLPPERKTKRANLLMRPSLWADLQKIAYMQHGSVNDMIHTVLCDYAKDHAALIEQYDKLF